MKLQVGNVEIKNIMRYKQMQYKRTDKYYGQTQHTDVHLSLSPQYSCFALKKDRLQLQYKFLLFIF